MKYNQRLQNERQIMRSESEYAKAGVDYSKIEPFKRAMIRAGAQTLAFPNGYAHNQLPACVLAMQIREQQ